ncbi:TEKT4 protein, partial [Mystacornis crossleyi]|nr:TEKT4 protein [Mystacornis crossleyi]
LMPLFQGENRFLRAKFLFYPIPRSSSASTPKSWAQFSHDNISSAEQEKLASVQLRSLINSIIHDASEDLRMQWAVVNEAFDNRCRELDDAKLRLEQHLEQILKDIANEEANIVNLRKAIRDKEAHLKVAHTRL